MITFWLVCAGMVAIALAFILPTLLARTDASQASDERGRKEATLDVYRDQIAELEADLRNGMIASEQYQVERDELERRLLEDVSTSITAPPPKADVGRSIPYAIAVAIPLLATGLYLQVGSPATASAPPNTASSSLAQNAMPAPDAAAQQKRMEANVAALAKRLEQSPNDVQGWSMLGRSYTSMERYNEAVSAFAKATALSANDAELLADYAFSLAMANGQSLRGRPTELINRALKIDPQNPKALELAGSAAFELKEYSKAIEYWQKLLDKTPANSEVAQAVSERIAEAKRLSRVPQ
jgi:cytochrome c-type biogenesis protein CcmH